MRNLLALAAATCAAACGGSSPWSEQPLPVDGYGTTFTVWAFADDDVWLGGSSTWNFDGSTWTEVPLPRDSNVADFWGFGPEDLWAMGGDAVFRWDGVSWTELPGNEQLPFESLSVIWGAAPDDVWIANGDNSKVYHYDGQGWTRQTLQFVYAHQLWGNSSDDIWLTGPFDTYHYDGASWTVYEPPDFDSDPRGAFAIWGSAPDDVWASGDHGMLHWEGSAWRLTELDEEYNSMWGFGPDQIYAVGNRGAMARYDGDDWSESTGHLSVRQNFTHLHGSSPDNLWATGVDFDSLSGMLLKLE